MQVKIINDEYFGFIKENIKVINSFFDYSRDFGYTYFGYKTLEKSYLKRSAINNKIIERPQHLNMRVAVGIHYRSKISLDEKLKLIKETYELISTGYFTHATPTLFNAGTLCEQLSSCFLFGVEDSMEGIGDLWKECGITSKYGGGIGIGITNVRSNGAYINSTQGKASGLKVLKIFNEIALYADQGGKRNGSIAAYVELWHNDIEYFLELKKISGSESDRARDLFYALMVNDLFMKRVECDEMWSLMCPTICPNIVNKYGDEFEKEYIEYEKQGKYIRQINARTLMKKIITIQFESGVPYILFKDAINKKSNQKHIGVINNSNLCAEIVQYSSSDEYAVCLSGETLVYTNKGYIQINELNKHDVKIMIPYSDPILSVDCNESYDYKLKYNGLQHTYKVYTQRGDVICATLNHKFLVKCSDKNKWVELNDLKLGDRLVINDKTFYKLDDEIFRRGFFSCINKSQDILNSDISIIVTFVIGHLCSKIKEYNDFQFIFNVENKSTADFISNALKTTFIKTIRLGDSTIIINDRLAIFNFCNIVYNSCNFEVNVNEFYLQFINTCFDKYENQYDNFVNADNLDEIMLIEYNKLEPVYDVMLDSYHNFIANNIVVHNCNLASICLPKFIKNGDIDYKKLADVAGIITNNLNNVIDINFYPVQKMKLSNFKHRPIGIGVQGLADVFIQLELPFDSEMAREINIKIFEAIYFGSLTKSIELAKIYGKHETFENSPFSKGILQFDMWENFDKTTLSRRFNWNQLKKDLVKHGSRNCLLTTCMPTASTSQIMNNNECIEPFTSNIYIRKTLGGEFYMCNKYLRNKLTKLGIWDSEMVERIKYNNGSIQDIQGIPKPIKEIFKTVWEIPQKSLIEMSADRAPFIDQTQSLNLFVNKNDPNIVYSALMYGWKLGLKTGMYYLRTKSASQSHKFGIDINKQLKFKNENNETLTGRLRELQECESCNA